VHDWFSLLHLSSPEKVHHFVHWCGKDRTHEKCSKDHVKKMDNFLSLLKNETWIFAENHIRNYGMSDGIEHVRRWKSNVESRGCRFLITTIFRDPLNHYLSLHQKLDPENIIGQLDFFMTNYKPLSDEIDGKERAKQAIDILTKHFDFVFYENHDLLTETILNVTGLPSQNLGHTNKNRGRKSYSKEGLSDILKHLNSRGDIDFINAVKYNYDPSRSYIFTNNVQEKQGQIRKERPSVK